jgi:hypothetical protein
MKTTESILKLAPALVKAQGDMLNIKRNAENPFFHSSYADLAKVIETVRPVLFKHGLAVIQFAEKGQANGEGQAPTVVITRLIHESGEWMETEVSSYALLKTPQEYGSTVTYLRRYSLMAICGTASEDDDDAEITAQHAPDPGNKPKGKKEAAKEITIQQRLEELPTDLKDLFAKAGAVTINQRFQLMKSVAWNTDAAKKACLKQIQG